MRYRVSLKVSNVYEGLHPDVKEIHILKELEADSYKDAVKEVLIELSTIEKQ